MSEDNTRDDDRTGSSSTGASEQGQAGTSVPGAAGQDEGGAVRTESCPCTDPAELNLSIDLGRIEVALDDGASAVDVEVRVDERDASGQGSWGAHGGQAVPGAPGVQFNMPQGIAEVLNWLKDASRQSGSNRTSGQDFPFGGKGFPFGGPDSPFGGKNFPFGGADSPFGKNFPFGDQEATPGSPGTATPGQGGFASGGGTASGGSASAGAPGTEFDLGELAAAAVRATEVTWSGTSRRLVVRSPSGMPLRMVPLVLTVRAPAGSRITLHTRSGQITVTGRSGTASAEAGSGDITLDRVGGDLNLSTGSGAASVRAVTGRTSAKTGSGNLVLDALDGPADLQSGSGNVRLGTIRADLSARASSGDVTIDNAEAGRLDLTTGSGDVRIAVHAGAAAELDVRSGSGRARSELTVSDTAPTGATTALHIHGRTGSGNVLVTRALSGAGAAS